MDALKKMKSTTKGQLTRLCQQMETVVKSKVLDIKNLAKLRAIMTDIIDIAMFLKNLLPKY